MKISVNKSLVLEHAAGIRRISISNPEIAEAVAVSSTEVLLNGKAVGETTLLLWDSKGARSAYDVQITASTAKLQAVRKELLSEVGSAASISVEDGAVSCAEQSPIKLRPIERLASLPHWARS